VSQHIIFITTCVQTVRFQLACKRVTPAEFFGQRKTKTIVCIMCFFRLPITKHFFYIRHCFTKNDRKSVDLLRCERKHLITTKFTAITKQKVQ